MPNPHAPEDIDVIDVAVYLRDMAEELAVMARRAGLGSIAGGFEQAHRAAAAEAQALQSDAANAAPDDAA
jgi:hypothetical protein